MRPPGKRPDRPDPQVEISGELVVDMIRYALVAGLLVALVVLVFS